jgi:hypothetical protein
MAICVKRTRWGPSHDKERWRLMADTRDSLASSLLLELFRQANEHSRETDRKRNILLGSYLTIVGVGAGWLIDAWPRDLTSTPVPWLVWFILAGLLIVGLPVLRAVTVYRAWHAYYGNISKAVQWSSAHDLTLYEGACQLISDASNRYEYFSPRGVEFTMFLFILVLWSILLGTLGIAVLLTKSSLCLPLAVAISSLAFAAALVLGIWCYRHHLLGEQRRFPQGSWMVISPPTQPESHEDE